MLNNFKKNIPNTLRIIYNKEITLLNAHIVATPIELCAVGPKKGEINTSSSSYRGPVDPSFAFSSSQRKRRQDDKDHVVPYVGVSLICIYIRSSIFLFFFFF